ncbi:MAG: helix-turn-helix transcriptional regulator [Ktedonobacteraceae bacterium]|nr:helix-turn-helix transcriptional regulator [Ktedonobacteraceae bacterium]
MDHLFSTSDYQGSILHPEQVVEIRQKGLPLEKAKMIGSLFAILKDPTRLQVVYALLYVSTGEVCVSDLATGLGRDDTTISHQLSILRSQRIVSIRKEGRVVYYRLIDNHIQALLELVLSHIGEEVLDMDEI